MVLLCNSYQNKGLAIPRVYSSCHVALTSPKELRLKKENTGIHFLELVRLESTDLCRHFAPPKVEQLPLALSLSLKVKEDSLLQSHRFSTGTVKTNYKLIIQKYISLQSGIRVAAINGKLTLLSM